LEVEKILKLENVSYKSEKDILDNISFSLNTGENLVLFGPENSGIEIICSIISGLIKTYEGDVFYKGKSVKSFGYLETHNYRRQIGYLQRDYGLISNMTVFENISLPLKYHSDLSSDEIERITDESIREMNLVHCKNLRPVKLTRSEKLKTAYLRSIAFDPDLILIEHSLAGQCLINVQTFMRSLKKESHSKTRSLIFVTYDPMLFTDLSDKYIMFYNGNIVFKGSRKDLSLTDNQYLKQYLESSIEGPMEIM
jgi:phospholipid/cholesterol/gamma-HCH transport system ATP-binding protein